MHVATALTNPTASSLRSSIRRLVLLALAALVLGSGLGFAGSTVGARRADALTPGAPRVLGPIGWDHKAYVAWSLPYDGGKNPTSFKVERYFGDEALPQKVFIVGGNVMTLVDSGLANNQTYRYRVQAFNADGASAWSGKEAVQPKEYRTDLAPFSDADDYIDRQYQDLLGRAPSLAERYGAKQKLANGVLAGTITNEIALRPERVAERFPVIRLYFAFFKRSPDLGGTNYWIGKRKAGMNLNTIASHFAGSSEFKNKYGNLTNQQYVTAIYQNVFDREPDAGGLAYWTNQLAQGKKTRGQVMVQFSESSEYAGKDGQPGKSTARVVTADFWLAIMKAPVSKNGIDVYYAPHVKYGGNHGTLAMLLMPTLGYPD